MKLPDFKSGQPLTAEAMNAIGARVRELQVRACGEHGARVRRGAFFVPGRQFGFRLGLWNGLVWVRQGWVDAGHGRLYAVGEQEWNALGALRAMTVWLEMTEADGRVMVTEYDEVTPESNLRRRLGYVREEVDGDGGSVWHAVQLLGGLVTPAAPRRTMGRHGGTGEFRKGDECWDWVRAGNLRGEGFAQVPGRWYAGRSVGLGYMVDVAPVQLAAEDGGARLMQVMSICGGG